MTEKIIKEYEISGLGRVRIIHEKDKNEENFNGEYFARVETYGNAGRFSGNPKEAESRMITEMESYLNGERKLGEMRIMAIKKGLAEIAKRKTDAQPTMLGGNN